MASQCVYFVVQIFFLHSVGRILTSPKLREINDIKQLICIYIMSLRNIIYLLHQF